MTSATESTIEIRATMSARNSSDAFDLECLIREKLVAYMQEQYPDRLPMQCWKGGGSTGSIERRNGKDETPNS